MDLSAVPCVQGAETNYQLTIGQGIGVEGTYDGMTYHNGQPFSTPDRDNDAAGGNCATSYGGAWWYKNCVHSSLNGRYGSGQVYWRGVSNINNVAMKIRPKTCLQCGRDYMQLKWLSP